MRFGKVLDFDDQTRVNIKPLQVPCDLPPGDYTVQVHALWAARPGGMEQPVPVKLGEG